MHELQKRIKAHTQVIVFIMICATFSFFMVMFISFYGFLAPILLYLVALTEVKESDLNNVTSCIKKEVIILRIITTGFFI